MPTLKRQRADGTWEYIQLTGEDITAIQNKIGVLTDLQTTEKGNLVGAINEVLNNNSSTAAKTSITDSGGFFNSDNTEGALQEVGQAIAGIRTSLVNSAQSQLN